MTEKELQEKIMTYRILESRLDSLLKQRDLVASKLIEMQTTLASIDEIHKSASEILFPIGSEAYASGEVVDKDKIIVEIGANIALEKSVEDGKEILNKRGKTLEESLNEIQREISNLSAAINQLGPEIQELTQELQSQAG